MAEVAKGQKEASIVPGMIHSFKQCDTMAEETSPTLGITDKYCVRETRNNPVFCSAEMTLGTLLLIVTIALEESQGKLGDSPEKTAQNHHTASKTKNKRPWFV